MTHVAAQFAAAYGVAASRVLSSGTTLDTARSRALLGRHFDVDPTDRDRAQTRAGSLSHPAASGPDPLS
jgi:malate/lactate dehydrogenase